MAKYKYQIHKRVKPYLKRLRWENAQSQKDKLQREEKFSLFQKQLKEAYGHIQKLSLDLQEKAFQTDLGQLKEQLAQLEPERQQSQQYMTENQQLKNQLLQMQNNNSERFCCTNTCMF